MKRIASLVAMFLTSLSLYAIDPADTRMLTQPAVGPGKIAFIYAEDLWVANADGSSPKRLTIDQGIESLPAFSPDGKTIAFSAQYEGNIDVYIISSEGGIPTRLTWHPGADMVRGFSPDGKDVLFLSQRAVFTNRHAQLFTVPVGGGLVKQLEIPNANYAAWSPDGNWLAYTPLFDAFAQWKNYRGGRIATILLYSFKDKSVVKIPQPDGGCNDASPTWVNGKVYFRSDRNGEFNLYSYDLNTKSVEQLTDYRDFPILNLSANKDRVLFEQAGYLHQYDPAAKATAKLTIGIAADLLELRPRFAKGAQFIRGVDISPSGSRVAVDFRGEIFTLPAEKGDPRNLTESPAHHENNPAWSPDGKSIAYFSDASGEYELHIRSQDGKGETRKIKLNGDGFYAFGNWSPDSKYFSYVDNGRNLYVLTIATGNIRKIDTDEVYHPGPFRDLFGDWSSDSKWIAYTKINATNFSTIRLYSIEQDKSFPVTDGLSDVTEPVFDPAGKYLFFFASTNAGPVVNWFDQSNQDMRATKSIYLATLQKETISPFAKESDEEMGDAAKPDTVPSAEKESKDSKKPKDKKEPEPAPKQAPRFRIDIEGIQNRIIDLPIAAGNYGNLGMGKDNELLYIKYQDDFQSGFMHKYDIKKRKDTEVVEMMDYALSADGKKMVYVKANAWTIAPSGEKPEMGKGALNTAALQVKIDPVKEWNQIFEEAWRVNRDYFYDPGMHGADWQAIREKYRPFLAHLSTRSDLNRVIQWMCSELAVGHHNVGGGDRIAVKEQIPGGLLGADFTIANNRYRLKKIYGGLNWTPNLRSPLTEPGVNAKEGDYILAVNGKEVVATESIYKYFEATAGKIVELTIGPNPTMNGSRIVKVVPVANELDLRNRDWVEGNIRKVTEATKGQVAYVYVPNTADAGHEYFKRYFFPQANRKAIIIDERFNGGGQLADYYIDILRRPEQAYWHTRYGQDIKSPTASIQGPKVMIIDETAGSGGDMLPWMFRKFNLGTLVGKRTWGGLVGILGFPVLMDGGMVTAPNLAIWTKDGFIVENVGVAPDIEVEQTPAEVISGKDPQLEKAIEIALKELEKNPPVQPKRPAFPVRVRK